MRARMSALAALTSASDGDADAARAWPPWRAAPTSPPTTSSRGGAGACSRCCHQSRKVSFGGVGRSRIARPARDRRLRQRPAAQPRQPLRGLVAPPRRERGGHALHRQRLRRQPRLLLAHDPAAQVHEDRGDVDLDRADLVTGAAQRGRPGQRRRLVQPAQQRRQDRADRAGIDGLVGLAADALVDRADVQAGRAADAVQRRRGRPRRPARRCGRRRAARDGTPAGRHRDARRSTATCRGSSARRSRSAAAAAGRPRGPARTAAPSRSP